MAYFTIIIPTVNGREEMLQRATDSIYYQTFTNWCVKIVHDNSGKEDVQRINMSGHSEIIEYWVPEKLGAGGARNIALITDNCLEYKCDDRYILFLDDDDELANDTVLEELHDFIEKNNRPDLIRLGYVKHFTDSGVKKIKLINEAESDLNTAMLSTRIGPPTKCIKADSRRNPLFVEGVKHQDIPHHILTCLYCKSCAVFDKPYFIYNIYDRPDKAIDSEESKKAAVLIPKYLKKLEHESIATPTLKKACDIWIKKLERLYGHS